MGDPGPRHRCEHWLVYRRAWDSVLATAAALRVPPERWSAARAALAPAGASAIRLCRYSGLNARPRLFMPGQVLTLLGTPYARDGLIAFAQGPMGAARGTPL